MAAADADESPSRLSKKNTGGSDALWEHVLSKPTFSKQIAEVSFFKAISGRP
jgi:hypothetical protein